MTAALKIATPPPARHEAQKRAADPSANVWVNASAGTGKTRVLVDRVLRLLLSGVSPWKILCLTYTKAAAAEMSTRLSRELGAWAVMGDEALRAELQVLTGDVAETEELARARTLFAALLDAPGGLQISTVHSFCQSLLARFSLEAGVAPGFQVLDDRLSAAMLAEAEREMLTHPSPAVDAALTALLRRYARSDFTGLLKAAVSERVKLLNVLKTHGGVVGVAARLRSELDVLEGAAPLADFAKDKTREAIRPAVKVLVEGKNKTDQENGAVLLAWLEAKERAPLYEAYRRCFLTQKNERCKPVSLMGKKLAEANPAALEALLVEQEHVWELEKALASAEVLERTVAFLTVAADLLTRYELLKRDRLALDYDDLIAKAAALVKQGAPWVMYKLDGGIDHILVDEAQDSNPAQWDIVEALAGEFYSGAQDKSRTLFAVGDYKQSIYRFQGAAPEAFLAARQRVKAKAEAADQKFRDEVLNISFRSVEAVLQTVDAVFRDLDFEEGMSHVAARKGMSGRVELWPLLAPAEEVDAPDFESAASTEAPAPAVLAARVLAKKIKSWVGTEDLKARGRKLAAGDVLVLVQRRGAFVENFIREAKQAGLPVSGVDRMKILEQLAVEDMLALADFLLLPEDDLTLAAVLKGPLIGIGEDELFALAHGRSGRLWENVKGPARDYLASLLNRADRMTPHALFSHILNHTCPAGLSGRKAMLTRLGPDAADPLDELLAAALQYEGDEAPTLSGFLAWLRRTESEIKRELEQAGGQVRVMTVHGAKGLQAPVVILADAAVGVSARRDLKLLFDGENSDAPPLLADGVAAYEDTLWADLLATRKIEDEAEYRRLLYVALTRAEDRLIIVGWRGQHRAPAGNWHELVAAGLGKLAVPAPMELAEGWSGEGLVFETKQEAAPKTDKERSAADEVETTLQDWAYAPAAAEPQPSRPLSPSKPDEVEPGVISPLLGEDGARFRRGLLIHRLLQTLPDLPKEKRRLAALTWLGKEPDAAALADEVLAAIDDPRAATLFGPQSRAEVPITGVVGPKVVSGRMDRLAVTDEAIWLVDFKTNRPPPGKAELVSATYLRQLSLYRALLERVYQGRPLRAFLLWTYGPQFMEIPSPLLDAHAPPPHI